MAVGDHGALDGAHRIDVEAARLAAQPRGDGHQDVLRTHLGLYRAPCAAFYPVMRGHSGLPCADYVNLSTLPRIHLPEEFLCDGLPDDSRSCRGQASGNDECRGHARTIIP